MRSRSPILPSTRSTWVLTIASDRYRRWAISGLDSPRPSRVSTSQGEHLALAGGQRCESGGLPTGVGWRGLEEPLDQAAGGLGAMTASPASTARIAAMSSAASVSLSRNPLAPARSPAIRNGRGRRWSAGSPAACTVLRPAASMSRAQTRERPPAYPRRWNVILVVPSG